jgi:hypothetical protein
MSASPSTVPSSLTDHQPQIDKVLEYLRQQETMLLGQQSPRKKEQEKSWCFEDVKDFPSVSIPEEMTMQEDQILPYNEALPNKITAQAASFHKEEAIQLASLIMSQMKKGLDMKRLNAKVKEFQEVQNWLTITGFYDNDVRNNILALHDKIKTGNEHMVEDVEINDKDPFNVQGLINQVIATTSPSLTTTFDMKKESNEDTVNAEDRKFIRYIRI